MALPQSAIPSSVRAPRQDNRFARAGASSLPKPFLVQPASASATQAGPFPVGLRLPNRADGLAAIHARALRLPPEPEDAKLTGATRSLNRRLLGLNVAGSLLRSAS